MPYTLPILDIQQITHDVKQFTLPKPENYSFGPGQAAEVSIDKHESRDEKALVLATRHPR